MKIVRMLLKGLFWLLIMALLLAPVGLILQISQEEMKQYETPEVPILREVALGTVLQAEARDVKEYLQIGGTITSSTYAYMGLDYETVQDIRWYVDIGDEIQEGQLIASGPYGQVIAAATGIVRAFHLESRVDCYVKVQQFAPVELECNVSDTALSMLQRGKEMTTVDGEAVTLLFASEQKNADGTTKVRVAIESDEYTFGEYVALLQVYTGRVFQNSIVLPMSCVYQKSGGTQWYARQVSESGVFIREIPVTLGFSDGSYVCVTGVNAGDYFDSGYKLVAEG